MISSVRAADPPILSPFPFDGYYNGTDFQLPEPPPIPGDDYAILSADITTASEGTVTDEWEIPYDIGSGPPDIDFTNEWSEPLTLSNVGFQLSITEIPLDSLNLSDDTPLPSLDVPLDAGASTPDVPLAPEPASLGLIALGGIFLWAIRCLLYTSRCV